MDETDLSSALLSRLMYPLVEAEVPDLAQIKSKFAIILGAYKIEPKRGGAGRLDRTEKSTTNADRIRAMTDEELAEYLDGVCHDLWQMFVKDPKKMWLDWLKQEAE